MVERRLTLQPVPDRLHASSLTLSARCLEFWND